MFSLAIRKKTVARIRRCVKAEMLVKLSSIVLRFTGHLVHMSIDAPGYLNCYTWPTVQAPLH